MSDSARIRERLTTERAQTQARIASLDTEFKGLVDAGDQTNIDDEHDPEGATIAFERAQIAALIEQAQTRLHDLDHALESLEGQTYGICEQCGKPIAAGRLAARPSARTCIECASKR